MPTDKDVKSLEPDLPELIIPQVPNPPPQPARGALHNGPGNLGWTWVGDTGTTGTAPGILEHLDASDLKIEGPSGRSVGSHGRPAPAPDRGGGYDPYNQAPSRSSPATPTRCRGSKR